MTKARKPAKPVRTRKAKVSAKKPPSKLLEKVTKKVAAVPEQGQNVPPKLSYKELLSSLPEKYARFVEEYLIDLNETKAAIRAGYAESSAHKQGYRMTRNVQVKAAIEAGKAEISKRNMINQDEVIKELALIGFADMADFIKIDESGAIYAIPLDGLAEGKSRIIRKVKEKRIIRSTQGTKDKPDGDQILESTYEFELCDKVTSLRALLDRVKPSEPQKLEVTVTNLTCFPPQPKTMAEWEALVKGGKI
jgi:phage terminase small subunit